MANLTRRGFITGPMAATLGAVLPLPSTAWSKVRGANDDIPVAIVGLRKKGKQHIEVFHPGAPGPGVRVVALCDADTQFLDRQAKPFADRHEKVDTYIDYRKLLEDKDIDAVVVVTPDLH